MPSSASSANCSSTPVRTSFHDTRTPLSREPAASPVGCGGHTTGPTTTSEEADGDTVGEGSLEGEADTDGDSLTDGLADADDEGDVSTEGLGADGLEGDASGLFEISDAGSAGRSVPARGLNDTDGEASVDALGDGDSPALGVALGVGVLLVVGDGEPVASSGLGSVEGVVVGDEVGVLDGESGTVGAWVAAISSPDSAGLGVTASHGSRSPLVAMGAGSFAKDVAGAKPPNKRAAELRATAMNCL